MSARDTYREARKQLWTSLRDSGATYQEIATTYGVSRERVRQVVGNRGDLSRRGDPVAILRCVRRPTTTSWQMVAAECRTGIRTAQAVMDALDLREAVDRLFRWRHRRVLRKYDGDKAARRRASLARGRALGTFTHGASGYTNYGCRCAVCREGKRESQQQSRHRATKRGCPPEKHGTPNGYCYYWCRCAVCREAIRAYNRGRRPRQKEAQHRTACATRADPVS